MWQDHIAGHRHVFGISQRSLCGVMQLIDHIGRMHTYLRVAVTTQCNLRCRYCDPNGDTTGLAPEALLSDADITHAVRLLANLGVTKVRLTGGEPTLRPGMVHLVQRLAEIEGIQAVHLTTNGTTLRSLAPLLSASGLAGVNVSLDTLQRARFTYVTGADRFDEVLAGIHAALDAGFPSVRLNVVVMAGLNDDELLDFVTLACNMPLDVRFIEHMPFGRQDWRPDRCVTMDAMMREIGTHYPLVPLSRVSGHDGVAREYRVAGAQGTIGFIAPVSQPFCAQCTRLRLTATGRLQTCLFASPELDLVAALRSGVPDDILAQQLQEALACKPGERPPLTALSPHAAPAMRMIGG